jgi:hypothetical protein
MVTKEEKSKIGKKSRIDGAKFELVVRLELEKNGWVVIKNPNNVIEDKDNIKHFKQGKSKYNPFTKRIMMSSGGFPDFLAYKPINNSYEIIGVESKINGYLDKEEREKCEWILEKKIFSKILVASKVKNGRKVGVKYETFEKDN